MRSSSSRLLIAEVHSRIDDFSAFEGSISAVGQRVEANFEGEGEWFAGVVDKVEDGRYDITYDDGDEEFGVEAARVRAATGDADVLAPLPAPQDELRRSDEYEESFEEEN